MLSVIVIPNQMHPFILLLFLLTFIWLLHYITPSQLLGFHLINSFFPFFLVSDIALFLTYTSIMWSDNSDAISLGPTEKKIRRGRH